MKNLLWGILFLTTLGMTAATAQVGPPPVGAPPVPVVPQTVPSVPVMVPTAVAPAPVPVQTGLPPTAGGPAGASSTFTPPAQPRDSVQSQSAAAPPAVSSGTASGGTAPGGTLALPSSVGPMPELQAPAPPAPAPAVSSTGAGSAGAVSGGAVSGGSKLLSSPAEPGVPAPLVNSNDPVAVRRQAHSSHPLVYFVLFVLAVGVVGLIVARRGAFGTGEPGQKAAQQPPATDKPVEAEAAPRNWWKRG